MTERVTVSLDKETAEELRRLARQEGKPLSALVRQALQEWVLHGKKKRVGEELLSLIEERPRAKEDEAFAELQKIREEWQ